MLWGRSRRIVARSPTRFHPTRCDGWSAGPSLRRFGERPEASHPCNGVNSAGTSSDPSGALLHETSPPSARGPQRHSISNQRLARALSASAAKAALSNTAMSASTLRSTSIPASDNPLIKRE